MAALSESSVFESLFQSALEQYEKQTGINLTEHPLAIQLESCNSVDSITEVLQEQARSFCEFRGGNNKVITSLRRAVQVLHKLSATIVLGEDIGLPVSLVKTIHTGIGTLMAAVKDVSASYDALVDLFESIGGFLERLDIYTKIPPTPAMSEMVVKILVQLISTLAHAIKQIKQGRLKKFGKKLFGDNDIEAVLHRLDRLTLDEARTTAAQTLEVVYCLINNLREVMSDGQASTDGIQKALEMIQQLASDMNRSKRDQLRRDVRRWLSPPDPWKNHNIGREAHHNGTARWFIEGDSFAEWKSFGSLLWIHGKPGSGKSILCSTIIECIDGMRKSGLASLAFYYFDFRDVEKKDRRGLLSSLIFQLCDQSDTYCDILSDVYSTHRDGSQYPSDSSLTQCIKHMLDSPGQAPVYLILDALDECPNSSGTPSPREKVLMLVEELVGIQLPNLRICLTSRPEIDIKATLDPLKFHSISLHDEGGQQEDILEYIRSVIHSDPKSRRWRAEDKELVIDVLSEKANGMFRWVFCQYDYLRRCIPARLRRALDELPTTLDETYDRTLEDIDDRNWEFALRLFQCIVVASRPLEAEELAEFLAFDFEAGQIPEFHKGWRLPDPVEAVLSTCSSLITVVAANNSWVVQFSHFSVKEYLTSAHIAMTKERISRFQVHIAPAHVLVTQSCLSILLQLHRNNAMDGLMDLPLASYATDHWADHAQFEDAALSVHDNLKLFFDPNKSHFATWIMTYKYFHATTSPVYPQPRRTPLQYAARLGFLNIVEFLVTGCSQDVNSLGISWSYGQYHIQDVDYLDHVSNGSAWNDDTWTPLQFAIVGGHSIVGQFLLGHGANVDSRDRKNQTSLHLASTLGHPDIVQLLFDYEPDVDARDNDGSTPLHCASRGERLGVSQAVLESGANARSQDADKNVPLHRSSSFGRLDVVHVLLKHGADVNPRDNDGCTPLHFASHLRIFQALLENGADVNSRDNNGRTPLHLISDGEHLEVSRTLLTQCVGFHAPRNDGRATRGGHLEVFQALLENGADVNSRDNDEWTPLHRASHEGHLDVSRALLECGADVNPRDSDNRVPLHRAAGIGCLDVVNVLLKHGADVNARDNYGWTPLHLASRGGHLEVSQALLENGADANSRDNDGRTSLHQASLGGHLNVSRALLECVADANSRDSDNRVPLHLASLVGCLDVVRVLLKHGADTDARESDGRTPLHLASLCGHSEVVWCLLRCGADASPQDQDLRTPLHLVLGPGRYEISHVFLEHDVDVNARDKSDRTPLQQAFAQALLGSRRPSNVLAVVKALLNNGADASAQDESYQTPLHLASCSGNSDIVRLLLQGSTSIHARNNHGRTPLQEASKKGYHKIVRLLLEYGAEDEGPAPHTDSPV